MNFFKFSHRLSFKCSEQELHKIMDILIEESLKSKVYGVGFSSGEYLFYSKNVTRFRSGMIYLRNTEPVMYAKIKRINDNLHFLNFYSKIRFVQQLILIVFSLIICLFLITDIFIYFMLFISIVCIVLYLFFQIDNKMEAEEIIEILKFRIAKLMLKQK